MVYTDLDLNVWSDGEKCFISVYGADEFDQVDTSNFITVEIPRDDFKWFTDGEDAWFGASAPEFPALLSTFVLYQLNEKGKE